MAKNCIGLDIGSSSIKAVQLKKTRAGYSLAAFGMQPLLPQTIVDGAIMDQAAVVEAIRALWSRMRLRQKDVAIAIAGHSVIIKKIAVPQMRADDLASQIHQEAEHHIPFAKDDVELDYHILNRVNFAVLDQSPLRNKRGTSSYSLLGNPELYLCARACISGVQCCRMSI